MVVASKLQITIEDLLRNDEWRLMFHGTVSPVLVFTRAELGKGEENHSALGLACAEWPELAAHYAQTAAERKRGGEPVVTAVLVPSNQPVELDYHQLFGYDDAGIRIRDRAGFDDVRQSLILAGYDIVDYQDSRGPYSISLVPEKVIVVAQLSLEQANALNAEMAQLKDPYSGVDRFEAMQQVLSPERKIAMEL